MEALERLRAWLAQWANPHGVKEIEKREEIQNEVSEAKLIAEPRRTLTMNLQVTKCEATPNSITVFFSEPVNQSNDASALNPGNYTIYAPPNFPQATQLSSSIVSDIRTFGSSAVTMTFTKPDAFNRGDWVVVTVSGLSQLDPCHATAAAHVNGKNALRIENVAANPTNLTVYFSDYLDTSGGSTDPNNAASYPIQLLPNGAKITPQTATYDPFNRATFLQLDPSQPLQPGQWILVTVCNVASRGRSYR
jgi:methionine-rich copper-binding protein CopC